MDIVTCPHCQMRVVPLEGGHCPSCRRALADAPAASVNPYDAPRAMESAAPVSFSRRAAIFSLCAPLAVMLIGSLAALFEMVMQWFALADACRYANLLLVALGVAAGAIGFVGGLQRLARGTILMAALGFVMNSTLLLAILFIAYWLATRGDRIVL